MVEQASCLAYGVLSKVSMVEAFAVFKIAKA